MTPSQKLLFAFGATMFLARAVVAQQSLTYPDSCLSACSPFLRLQSTPPCSVTLDNGKEDDWECVCKDNIYIVAQESCATCVFANYPAGLTIDNKTVSVQEYSLATYTYCQSAAAISPYSIMSVASASTVSVASASIASVAQASLASVSRAAQSTAAPSRSATPSPTPVPHKSSNTAAIAGGVAGGVGALLVLAGLLFFCMKRRKDRGGINDNRAAQESGRGAGTGGEEYEKRDAILHEPAPPVQPYIYSNPAVSSSGHFSQSGTGTNATPSEGGYTNISGLQSPASPNSQAHYQNQQNQQRSSVISSSMSGKALEARRESLTPRGGGAGEFGGGEQGQGGSGGGEEGRREVYHEDAGPVVEFPPSYQGQGGGGGGPNRSG